MFVCGQRGSIKLVYGNYQYTKSYTASGSTTWVCAKKNTKKCKARIKLNTKENSFDIIQYIHNHA